MQVYVLECDAGKRFVGFCEIGDAPLLQTHPFLDAAAPLKVISTERVPTRDAAVELMYSIFYELLEKSKIPNAGCMSWPRGNWNDECAEAVVSFFAIKHDRSFRRIAKELGFKPKIKKREHKVLADVEEEEKPTKKVQLGTKCFSCGERNHNKFSCPFNYHA